MLSECAHDSDQQRHAEGSADLSEGVADSAANRESFRWEFRDAGPGVGRIEASDADADDDNEGHEQSRIAGLVEADRHGRGAHADGQHTGYRREAEPDSRGQAPAEGRQGGHGDRADEGDEPGLEDGVGPRLTEKQHVVEVVGRISAEEDEPREAGDAERAAAEQCQVDNGLRVDPLSRDEHDNRDHSDSDRKERCRV